MSEIYVGCRTKLDIERHVYIWLLTAYVAEIDFNCICAKMAASDWREEEGWRHLIGQRREEERSMFPIRPKRRLHNSKVVVQKVRDASNLRPNLRKFVDFFRGLNCYSLFFNLR